VKKFRFELKSSHFAQMKARVDIDRRFGEVTELREMTAIATQFLEGDHTIDLECV
jgi:hypothetical protein